MTLSSLTQKRFYCDKHFLEFSKFMKKKGRNFICYKIKLFEHFNSRPQTKTAQIKFWKKYYKGNHKTPGVSSKCGFAFSSRSDYIRKYNQVPANKKRKRLLKIKSQEKQR